MFCIFNCHPLSLLAGLRSPVRHHYRGSKIALWLDLLPRLHKSDNLDFQHHLLDDSHNETSFEDQGTRPIDWPQTLSTPSFPTTLSPLTSLCTVTSSTDVTNTTLSMSPMTSFVSLTGGQQGRVTYSMLQRPSIEETEIAESMVTVQISPYVQLNRIGSLSLSITIAVGCSLLFLNVLVFAAVFHQKSRVRRERRIMKQELEQEHEMFTHLSNHRYHEKHSQQHETTGGKKNTCVSATTAVSSGDYEAFTPLSDGSPVRFLIPVGNHHNNHFEDNSSVPVSIVLSSSSDEWGPERGDMATGRGGTRCPPMAQRSSLPHSPTTVTLCSTVNQWPLAANETEGVLNHVHPIGNGWTVKHLLYDDVIPLSSDNGVDYNPSTTV